MPLDDAYWGESILMQVCVKIFSDAVNSRSHLWIMTIYVSNVARFSYRT